MKLAEALILRADTQKRLRQLAERLHANLRVQEGEEPAMAPADMMKEFDEANRQLVHLVKSINRTNSTTPLDDSRTIADALVERDSISSHRQLYSDMITNLLGRHERYARTEIRYVTTMDADALQKQVDRLSKEFRELDTRIQELNWRTDLIEA